MVINGGSAFDDQNTMVFKNEPFANGGTMVVDGVDKIGHYKSFKVAFLLVSLYHYFNFFICTESNLGTMVINESSENTMKQYGTVPGQGAYRYIYSQFGCR